MKFSRWMTTAGLSAVAMTAFSGLALAQNAGQPTDGGMGYQPPATPLAEDIFGLHNNVVFPIIVGIVLFVMVLMLFIMIRFNEKANPEPSKTTHNTLLEVVWTIVPVLILLVLVFPGMRVLYKSDVMPEQIDLTVKAYGNQWYWDYEYPDYGDWTYSSYMLNEEEAAAQGKPYTLGTDNPLVVPAGANVRVLVTANDVLHAFAVPSFGVKVDAIPGKNNEIWFRVDEPGRYYGPCSEICGRDHGFMPIEILVLPQDEFDAWLDDQVEQNAALDAPRAVQFAQAN